MALPARLLVAPLACLAAFSAAAPALSSPPAAPALNVAVDVDPTGNGPRTVGAVDDCVSVASGGTAAVDIVLRAPGVPADRGMAAYQFTLHYDPAVVWVETDDPQQLLAQASRSSVLPIADPKPDKNGVYISWAVDLGPQGIEPDGASETGAGVLARLTLSARAAGVSSLNLTDVAVIDDAAKEIPLDAPRPASLRVGQACPGAAGPQASPSPSPAATAAPAPPAAGSGPSSTDSAAVTALGPTGGPPAAAASPAWVAAGGLTAGLAAAVSLFLLRRRPASLRYGSRRNRGRSRGNQAGTAR